MVTGSRFTQSKHMIGSQRLEAAWREGVGLGAVWRAGVGLETVYADDGLEAVRHEGIGLGVV